MNAVRLIEEDDPAGWSAALEGIAYGIAHTHGFATLMARAAGAHAKLFVAEGEGCRFVCPVAERSIGAAIDIFSPYGFAGFAGAGDLAVLSDAWRSFARAQGYVTAFITQNPLTMPNGFGAHWEGFDPQARTLYSIDLTQPEDTRMARVSARTRSGLRKWLADARPETDQDLLADAFIALYPDFARRMRMPGHYQFSADVLRQLVALPGMVLAGARDAAGDVSCVVLMGAAPACGDYLFMASSPTGRSDGTGVLWCGLESLAQRDVPLCNLGGGIVEGDGVAEFKRRLGGTPVPLAVIRQVFDAARYRALCAEAGCAPDAAGFFPAYYKQAVRP